MRFREWITRWMYGRYGMDELYRGLLFVYLGLIVLNLFLRSPVVALLMWLVVGFAVFRVFSRNMARRQAENAWYLARLDRVKRWFRLCKKRFEDRNTHAYKTCPYCKAVVRLARVHGKHTCTCPRCRRDFSVRM